MKIYVLMSGVRSNSDKPPGYETRLFTDRDAAKAAYLAAARKAKETVAEYHIPFAALYAVEDGGILNTALEGENPPDGILDVMLVARCQNLKHT